MVDGRVTLGVLGLLVLLALWLGRRLTRLGTTAWTPPGHAVAIPLTAVFALAGFGLTGISLMELSFGDHDMVGANLAEGLVALVFALGAGLWLLPRRRRSGAPGRSTR